MAEENLNTERDITAEKVKQTAETKKVKQETKGVKDELTELLGLSSSYVDSLKETLGIKSRLSTSDGNLLKVNKEINKAILGQRKEYDDISSLQKQIATNEKTIAKAQNINKSLTKDISSESKKRIGYTKSNIGNISRLAKEEEDILKIAEKGGIFDQTRLDSIQKELASRNNTLDIQQQGLSYSEKQVLFSEQNLKALEKEQAKRLEEEKILSKINDSLGLTGALVQGLSKIPGLGGSAGKAFKTVSEKAKEITKETGKVPSRLKTMSMFAGEFGKELSKAVTDPLVVLSAIGAVMLKNNQKITDLSRSMAMSTSEAKTFAGEFSAISMSSDDINTTTANLVHNFQDMSESLGFMAKFSGDTLETATKLQYTLGLSADSVANLAGAAEVSGGNFDNQYKSALKISHEAQREVGVRVNLKKVLEDTGKITGQIRANLGGSIEEIAEAVTKATLFGSTLEDVASMGSKLLDFESSITAELEAEMLIGKNLNLEKARSAALAGDQVTLMEELNSQMGSLEDFQDMNVIQQQALAGAMGMTGDQLSDILMKQEIQGKTAEELREMGKDELANTVEKQSAQESFNAAVAQLQGLFADTMKFLNPIMEGFSYIVKQALAFKDVIVATAAGFAMYKGSMMVINALQSKNNLLSLKGLRTAIATAATKAASNPIAGIAGLVTAGLVYAYFNSKKADDMMSPGGNSGGYGSRTLMGPEGAISLNNKDTVIAGTDLFSKGDDVISKGAGDIKMPDNSETNSLLKQLISTNSQGYQRLDKKQEISPVGLYEIA
tara:strand:+ start:1170 stop:3518 length:2349 start_codon:yes stop_codon:yes gene_type:complete